MWWYKLIFCQGVFALASHPFGGGTEVPKDCWNAFGTAVHRCGLMSLYHRLLLVQNVFLLVPSWHLIIYMYVIGSVLSWHSGANFSFLTELAFPCFLGIPFFHMILSHSRAAWSTLFLRLELQQCHAVLILLACDRHFLPSWKAVFLEFLSLYRQNAFNI